PAAYSFAVLFRPTDSNQVTVATQGRFMDTDAIAAFVTYPNLLAGGTVTISPRDDSNVAHPVSFGFASNPIPAILELVTIEPGTCTIYANLDHGQPISGYRVQLTLPANVANSWGIGNPFGAPNILYLAGFGSSYTPHAILAGLWIWDRL